VAASVRTFCLLVDVSVCSLFSQSCLLEAVNSTKQGLDSFALCLFVCSVSMLLTVNSISEVHLFS